MSSNKSNWGCWFFSGFAGFLLLAGWLIHQQGWLGKKLTLLEGAKVIPDEAIVTGFINTEPKNRSYLSPISLPETEKIIESLDNFQPEFFDFSSKEYQQDIQPWLSGIMFAILPEQSANEEIDNLLIVVGIKNKLKALKFVSQLQKEADRPWQERKYRGIDITEFTNKNNETINSALLGSKLILSNDRQTIEKAIDTYRGESSLASEPDTKEILSRKLTIENPLVRVYFTNFSYLIDEVAKQQISAAAIAELQQIDSVAIGIGTQKGKIHLQSITNFSSAVDRSDFSTTKSKILTKLPTNTIAAINGHNINQTWLNTVEQIETDKDLRRLLNMARFYFQQGTGLDIDEDVFSWIDGEFAVSLLQTEKPTIPELGIGLESAIIIETSNRNKAQATLDKIQANLQNNLLIYPKQRKINENLTITEWISPLTRFSLGYGWLDDNYLVLSQGDSIYKKNKNSFKQSEEFKAIAQKLPNNNFGYFYLDMNQTMAIIDRLPTSSKTNITPEAMTILNSLQEVGATATMPDNSTSQLDILFLFK